MKNKALTILLILLTLTGCNAFTRNTPQALPTIVLGETSPTNQAPLPGAGGGATASGIMVPAQEAQLVFTLSGKVNRVEVAVGDQVKAGQVLVQLEGQENLEAAVSATQYELEQAQQALEALDKDLDVQQAQALKAIADYQDAVRDAERVIANLNSAAQQVDLEAAYANMLLAKDRLERARDDYQPYENKPEDNLQRAALLSKLAQVQKNYDATVRTYNNLLGKANPIDLNQAEANLALAQAQLVKAQRDSEILKSGPDQDKVRLAEARLANAQTQLAASQAALDHLTLTAPFAGTIAEVKVSSGEWLIAGQPVLLLADLDNLRVETTDLSERDVPKVEVGQAVTVSIKALGQDALGRVRDISPLANTLGGDVVYKTTIELDTLPPGLRAGMSVEVQFGTSP